MSDQHLRQLERDWQQNPSNESAINYMTALARNGDGRVDYSAWLRFLGGHWTLDPPTKCGMYQRATSQGDQVSPPILIFKAREALGGAPPKGKEEMLMALGGGIGNPGLPASIWKGYWWSEPTPELADPPVCAVENCKETATHVLGDEASTMFALPLASVICDSCYNPQVGDAP